jgi:hypothetical protein
MVDAIAIVNAGSFGSRPVRLSRRREPKKQMSAVTATRDEAIQNDNDPATAARNARASGAMVGVMPWAGIGSAVVSTTEARTNAMVQLPFTNGRRHQLENR